jgi:hypothetical protein
MCGIGRAVVARRSMVPTMLTMPPQQSNSAARSDVMSAFIHSLHHSGLRRSAHQAALVARLRTVGQRRFTAAKAIPLAAPSAGMQVPLSTVTYQPNPPASLGSFDSQIDISFEGAAAGAPVQLMVDSGNTTLIIPRYEDIAGLAGYTVLAQNTKEPWGCPAHIVRGPIILPTRSSGILRIPDCVFYACTGNNGDGERTANFGLGWTSPWTLDQSGVTVQAPLSYLPQLPFVEVDIQPAQAAAGDPANPVITEASTLTLHDQPPAGYQMLNGVPDAPWLSLVPKSLSIGGVVTAWPGNLASPIAMIDTGGGPVFLSDPSAAVYPAAWPNPVQSPCWTKPGSLPCESTAAKIVIELGDETSSYTYTIDETLLPPSVQGITLVMCKECEYMRGRNGMNIGGISMLVNYLVIDYRGGRVGLKPKPPG